MLPKDDAGSTALKRSPAALEEQPKKRSRFAEATPTVPKAVMVLTLTILYLFAGAERHCDFGSHMRRLCSERGIMVVLEEIDLLRKGEQHDVTKDEVWKPLLAKVASNVYDAVIATPPCNTHSRAPWSNRNGPRPIRDFHFPNGFPWLEGWQLQKAEPANMLVDKTLEVLELAAGQPKNPACLMEHPET